MLYRYLPKNTGGTNLSPVAPTLTPLSTGFTQVIATASSNDYSKVAIYGYTGGFYRIYYYDTQTRAMEQNTTNLVNTSLTFSTLAYTADGLCRRLAFHQTQARNHLYSSDGTLLETGPPPKELDGQNSSLLNVYANGRPGTTGSIVTAPRIQATPTIRDNYNTVRVTIPSARSTWSVCDYAPNRLIAFYSPTFNSENGTTEYVIYNTQNWSVVYSGVLKDAANTTASLVSRIQDNRVIIVTTNGSPASYIGVYSISDSGVSLIGSELPVVRDYPSPASYTRPSVAVHLGPNKDHIYYDSGQPISSQRDRVYGTSSFDLSTPTAPLSGLFKITEDGLVPRQILINYGMSGSQMTNSQICFSAPNGDLLIVATSVSRFDMSSLI